MDDKKIHNIHLSKSLTKVKPKEISLVPGEVSPILSWELKKGNLVEDRGEQKSESFVLNFVKAMMVNALPVSRDLGMVRLYFPGNLLLGPPLNTDGVVFSFNQIAMERFSANAAIGVITKGIVVGDGITAVNFNDFCLEGQISHGTAAGQLQHAASFYGEPASNGATSQFRLSRVFANGSPGAVVVNEVGVYCWNFSSLSTENPAFMIIRDVLGVAISIPAGRDLTLNYNFQAAV